MPNIAEINAETNAKLQALLVPSVSEPETKELTAKQALAMVAEELGKEGLSKERTAYLQGVLNDVQKVFFEDTSTTPPITIKVVSDPDQVQPATATANVQTIGTSTPNPSNLSTNRKVTAPDSLPSQGAATHFASSLAKAQALQQLIVGDRAELKKSQLTDKLDEIKSMFGITDKDLEGDGYELRWKIGDLITVLLDAIKLENLVGTSDGGGAAKDSAKKSAATDQRWPSDMASAKYDEKDGVFKNAPSRWE